MASTVDVDAVVSILLEDECVLIEKQKLSRALGTPSHEIILLSLRLIVEYSFAGRMEKSKWTIGNLPGIGKHFGGFTICIGCW